LLPKEAFASGDVPYWAGEDVESQLRAVMQTRRDSIDKGFREGFLTGSKDNGGKVDDGLQRRIEALLVSAGPRGKPSSHEDQQPIAEPTGVGLDFRPLHGILWGAPRGGSALSSGVERLERYKKQLQGLFLQGYTSEDGPLNAALAQHDHIIWHQHAAEVTPTSDPASLLLGHLLEHGYVGLPSMIEEGSSVAIHHTLKRLLDQAVADAVTSRPKGSPQPSVVKLEVPNLCALPSCGPVCNPINNSTILQIVKGYLGPDATIGFVEAFRLRANPDTEEYPSGVWHHDRVGKRLKLFVLLHDVLEGSGRPTQIIEGSHHSLYYSHTVFTARLKPPHAIRQGNVVKLAGRRGDAYLFDTNALHRGSYGTGLLDRDAIVYEFSSWAKYEALKAIDQGCAKKMGPRRGQRFPTSVARGPLFRPDLVRHLVGEGEAVYGGDERGEWE